MAVRNCLLAPSKAPNPSQRLEQCLRDCLGAVPHGLLWKASHAISLRAFGALCFYGRPKLLFWHSLEQCLRDYFGRPLTPSHLLHSVFMAVRHCFLAPSCLRHCLGRPLTPSHLVPWPHSVFTTVRNCLLAPSKAPNPSQRLEQCLRNCFGRHHHSASSTASETASQGLSRHLTSCLGRTLFVWPSETAFWHPQRLLTPRSASSNASDTASEGLSRHLTSCLGRTLFVWPSETAFWHPQRLLTPRSASSSA